MSFYFRAGEPLPDDAPDVMRTAAEDFPQNTLAAEEDGVAVGWACHNGMPGDFRASVFVYVPPERRRCGIGTALLKESFARMAAKRIETAMTHFAEEDGLSAFARKGGMHFAFRLLHMTYSGGPLPETAVFAPYTDTDYPDYQALQSQAFYDLRRSLDLPPYYMPARATVRVGMAKTPQAFFVLRDGGQLIAGGSFANGEIDDVAVLDNYRGRGLGKAVVVHAVNALLSRGIVPSLDCVEGNPARKLYLGMGFRTEKAQVHYRYSLK